MLVLVRLMNVRMESLVSILDLIASYRKVIPLSPTGLSVSNGRNKAVQETSSRTRQGKWEAKCLQKTCIPSDEILLSTVHLYKNSLRDRFISTIFFSVSSGDKSWRKLSKS